MVTHIVYSSDFLKHDNATHPENAQRLLVMINEIKKAPFYDKLEFIEPEILPEEMLNDVHSYEMIERIKDMSSNGGSWLDPDTYVCKSDYEIARLAAGGVVNLAKNVLKGTVDNGFGLVKGYTVNAPLSYSNGNIAVTKLLDEIFIPIAQQFKPDMILVSSGFDSHHMDILGGLNLTTNFFGEIIARLQKIQNKIVCTLEGGYNLDWIGKCLLSQLGQMTDSPVRFDDDVKENITVESVIEKIKNEMGCYWKI